MDDKLSSTEQFKVQLSKFLKIDKKRNYKIIIRFKFNWKRWSGFSYWNEMGFL